MIRLGYAPIVRPLFRGAKLGLDAKSAAALRALGPQLGFDLAYVSPPLATAEDAAAAIKAVRAADLDFLLLQHVTFATGDLAVPFLELPIPLGVWGIPESAVTGPLPQNSLCGLNMTLSLPAKRSLPAKWFYGAADDPAFQSRLATTIRALRGLKALNSGRVLQIGGTAPGFYRLEGMPDAALKVDHLPLEAAFAAMDKVGDGEVQSALDALDETTPMARDQLMPMLRLELALKRLGQGYEGIAMRCWPEIPERGGAVACAAFGRLCDHGLAMACEGDTIGLASMIAVGAVSGQPSLLVDLVHVDDQGLLFWHCGNAPRNWARDGVTRLDPHFNRKIAAVRDMRIKPGPCAGMRLVEGGRAIVYAGEVGTREDVYDGVSGWIGKLRWAGEAQSPRDFMASVLNHRLPHHFTWGEGDHEMALLELADWLGAEVLPPAPLMREPGRAPGMVRWAAS